MTKKKLFFIIIAFLLIALPTIKFAFAETVSITGTVPPKTTDFQLSIAAEDNKNQVSQGTELTYEITYGAKASAGVTTATTITADWSNDTASDGTHISDYVTGSASNAYNDTAPVVDLLNRKITWTISSLPPGTIEQTTTFKLKTNSNYSKSNAVVFTVKTGLTNQYITLSNQTNSQTYLYNSALVTPTPTNNPTNSPNETSSQELTPTPTPSSPDKIGIKSGPTPTTTPVPAKTLEIEAINFNKIVDQNTKLTITTSMPSKATIRYGKTPNSLSQSLDVGDQNKNIQFTLDELTPSTNYYFQVTVGDNKGHQTTSEIYTFKTAAPSSTPNIDNNVVIVSSKGTVIATDVDRQDSIQTQTTSAVITTGSTYEVTYKLRHPINIKSIATVMRNHNVLGINTFSKVLGTETITVPMTEKEPLVYIATLRSDVAGTFDILVHIEDTKGNLIEDKIAETKIISPFTVIDQNSKQPVADARIFLYYYNEKNHKYEAITTALFDNVANPTFTNTTGSSNIILPQGKYKAEISAFGYDKQTVNFILGTKSSENFPRVLLHKNPTNLINYLLYFTDAFVDFTLKVKSALNDLSFSLRFFNLIALAVIVLSICTTFFFFHMRTHISPRHTLKYFLFHLKSVFRKSALATFNLNIIDEAGIKQSQVQVETLDKESNQVLNTLISNKNGVCLIQNPQNKAELNLLITKEGFQPKLITIEPGELTYPEGLTVILETGESVHHLPLKKLWFVATNFGGLFFEFALLWSFILELTFLPLFGIIKTAPFFALSLFNLILWIFYQKEKYQTKVFNK